MVHDNDENMMLPSNTKMLLLILPTGAHGLPATISMSSNRLQVGNDSVINSLFFFYPLENQPSYLLIEKRPRVKGGPLLL